MDSNCSFCGEERSRRIEAFMDGWMNIIQADSHWAISVGSNDGTESLIFNINFCPVCGKRLDGKVNE